jgi:hypothetical protein
MNGKGDKRRPMAVTREEFEANWEAAFGPKPGGKKRRKASKKSTARVRGARTRNA